MKKSIVVLTAAALAALLFLSSCSAEKKNSPAPETVSEKVETTKTSETEIKEAEETYIEIQTPFAVLKAPESFADAVVTEIISENPYSLCFSAKDGTKLFTLHFGNNAGELIGTLINDNTYTVLYSEVFETDASSEEYENYAALQFGLETIINNLAKDYTFALGEEILPEDNTTFDIPTSIVTLKYPAKWQESVWVEVADNGVKFSCNSVPLFDIMFTECDGYLLGTYNGTPVYMVEYPVETQEQIEMQDDVNVIFQNLMQDSAFTVAE